MTEPRSDNETAEVERLRDRLEAVLAETWVLTAQRDEVEARWRAACDLGTRIEATRDAAIAALAAERAKVAAVEKLIDPATAMARTFYGERLFDEKDIRAALAAAGGSTEGDSEA